MNWGLVLYGLDLQEGQGRNRLGLGILYSQIAQAHVLPKELPWDESSGRWIWWLSALSLCTLLRMCAGNIGEV